MQQEKEIRDRVIERERERERVIERETEREREREKSNYSIIRSRTAEMTAARAQQKINTDHTMAVLHYSQV